MWVKPVANSAAAYELMTSVAAMSSGTVATGNFLGTATFGSGEAGQTTLTDSSGNGSIFLAHYRPDGSLVWAKSAVTQSEAVPSVATLADDTTFVAGSFSNTATFGPGEPDQTVLTTTTGAYYVARYAATGSLLWAKGFSATSSGAAGQTPSAIADAIAPVATDSSVVLGGNFNGSLDCGGTTLTNNTTNQATYFLAKYRSDGSLAWAKQGTLTGTSSDAIVTSVRSYSDGSFVATGWISGTVTFGPGETNGTAVATGFSSESIFVAKFNTDGTLAWVRSPACPKSAKGLGVSAVSDGSAITCGTFTGTVTFGGGEPNQTTLTASNSNQPGGFYVARYNADGTLAWAKTAPTTGSYSDADGVAAFSDGSSMVVGEFSAQCVFGSGEAGQTTLVSGNQSTPFVARYDADGTLAWVRSIDANNPNYARSVALADGLVVVTGVLQAASTTFGLGEPSATVVNGTGETAYIAAYFTTPH